jgi:hypothetical protein
VTTADRGTNISQRQDLDEEGRRPLEIFQCTANVQENMVEPVIRTF